MNERTVVVCRRASDPIRPGLLPGYKCSGCGQALVATAIGRAAIAVGGEPFCNSCGFKLAHRAMDEGKLGATLISPTAAAQIERLRKEMREEEREKG
jgi:DNA-directed RNA polymerase subunit RPC12/RpoP